MCLLTGARVVLGGLGVRLPCFVALVLAIVSYTSLGLARPIFPYVQAFINIHVLLAVFNLLPVPPLDGFGFLFGLAPRPLKIALLPLNQYGAIILLAVVFL